jgi:alkyl hydroperoxide reductase subunit AhpC
MTCRDQLAQLRRHADEFAERHTNVVTITFGPASRMQAWLRETRSPFVLLLDGQRTAYRDYSVRRSLSSLSIAAVRRGRELARQGQPVTYLQGDPLQLGGTFIVDASGIVRLAHRSSTPIDYPSVEELLTVLGGLPVPAESRPRRD